METRAAKIGIVLMLFCESALSQKIADHSMQLGRPPVFMPGQSEVTSQAQLPVQPAVATTINLNPLNRYQVSLAYLNYYVPEATVTNGWAGSIASCNAGTTSQAFQDATISRVNLYRALAGLPGNISEFSGSTQQIDDQDAALMFVANGQLNHAPPTTWTCYTSAGATGAGSSNIALGEGEGFNFDGPVAIDAYMDDSGNVSVGHRRWLLFPPQLQMSDGDIDSTAASNFSSSNALWVFGPWSETRPSTPIGEPWPPRGYLPWQLLPATSSYWSLSLENANFSNASVTMTRNGVTLSVSIQATSNNGQPSGSFEGDNTLVWIPTGVTYSKPTQDVVYAITVSGITSNGGGASVPTTVSYSVTVIDPNDAIFADGFE